MKTVSIAASVEEKKLLTQLLPENTAEEIYSVAFATVVWSRLAEPGDSVAGRLIDFLGAVNALKLVINGDKGVLHGIEMGQKEANISAKEITAGIERWRQRLDRERSREDLENAVKTGCKIILPSAANWPNSLSDLEHHAPLLLWTRGDQSLLQSKSLAVVGARASSAYGENVTSDFTANAIQLNHSIVSGAAYGIDAVAHRCALANDGKTIAVMAGGADRIYPAGHLALITRIAEEGLVCSEMVPGAAPTRWRFLQRNRIVAALARATLVTEAGLRSGSLNTAGHAAHLARPVGAVPGPITSVSAIGTHRLIKEYDARLVSDEQDLKELLGVGEYEEQAFTPGDSARQRSVHVRVLDSFPLRQAVTVKHVAQQAGLGISEVKTAIVELELLGEVDRCARDSNGGYLWRLQRRK